MNKTLRAVAIAALSVAALTPAMAQESPWQVRVRAVNLDPANKNSTPVAAKSSDASQAKAPVKGRLLIQHTGLPPRPGTKSKGR